MLRHKWVLPCGVILIALAFTYAIYSGSWLFFVISILMFTGLTAWGAFDIRLGYFLQVSYRKKKPVTKQVALTFDDGPSVFTPQVLDLLRDYDCKATFFCIGKEVQHLPHIANRILRDGHTIANHTFSHTTNFGFLSTEQVVAELETCNNIISATVDRRPTFFRPPFGVTNPSVAKAVQRLGLQTIGWSNRSLDTVIQDEDRILRRVLRKLQPGDIILLHDTTQRTVNVLRKILPMLKAEGYVCVSVDDLLNLQAYEA